MTLLAGARAVRNPTIPDVWDANCLTRVTAANAEEVEEVFAAMEVIYASCDHRSVKVDPFTPPAFEARLVLDGFEADSMVHLVLPDEVELAVSRPLADVSIRRVSDDDDWASLTRLARADHEEAAARQGRPVWSEGVTEQLVARQRQRADDMAFFLASRNGTDVAHACSWTGTSEDRVGMVEDLFTRADHRHRGVATALIARAVAAARAGGAGPVMIGAAVDDTPKQMYATLGFRPLFLTRHYVRTLSA